MAHGRVTPSPGSERALLVQPHAVGRLDAEVLAEFGELARSAGAVVVAEITARIERPNAAHYVGTGKLEEGAQLRHERRGTGRFRGVDLDRVRMDEIQPEASEEELAHEARTGPLALARCLRDLQQLGVWIYGLAGEATASLYAIDLRGNVALVLGGEADGLRRLTREHCDQLVKIPMPGDTESLNVSVATGVTLFEAVRQRQA